MRCPAHFGLDAPPRFGKPLSVPLPRDHIANDCFYEDSFVIALGKAQERGIFRSTATLKDDSLDTVATINTINGLKEKRGLLGIVWDDSFLRGYINKKTGATTIQLYQMITYTGSGWRFFQTVNFETPAGPESQRLTIISRDVDCSNSRYTGCKYVEHFAFDVDEKLLRIIESNYQPGQPIGWKYKFGAKSGEDYNDGMLASEVAGFLEALDDYRASKDLPQPR